PYVSPTLHTEPGTEPASAGRFGSSCVSLPGAGRVLLVNATLIGGAKLVRLPGIGIAGRVVVFEVERPVPECLVRLDQVAPGTEGEPDPLQDVVAGLAGLDGGVRGATQKDAHEVLDEGGRTDGSARRSR